MGNMEVENKREKRKGLKKINFWPFIILGLACYFLFQLYLMNANRVDTVKATEGYINDSIIAQGIVCRNEIVLTKSTEGAVDYLARDGRRVSKGALVGNVYPSFSDVASMKLLRNRERTLDDVNAAVAYMNGAPVDMSFTRKQLTNRMTKLSRASTAGNFTNFSESLANLTLALNKVGVAVGDVNDFSAATGQVQSEISALESSVNPATDSLTAPETGYFLSFADGYENIATVDNFLSLSPEEGEQIINTPPERTSDGSVYGKIITDYKWSVCTYIDKEDMRDMRERDNVQITLSLDSGEYQSARISKIVDFGEKCLVVIECTMMDTTAATARVTDIEILFRQYRGIKIPRTAIRFSDGEMGVYVNFSNIVQFKKISPDYEDDNYMIVPLANDEQNQVKLYDSIIVKGRNLYDGKYL